MIFPNVCHPLAPGVKAACIPELCPMMAGCTLRDVWSEFREATIALLGGVTFADLAKPAGGAWVDPGLIAPVASPSPST